MLQRAISGLGRLAGVSSGIVVIIMAGALVEWMSCSSSGGGKPSAGVSTLPPIDAAQPVTYQTATFAFG